MQPVAEHDCLDHSGVIYCPVQTGRETERDKKLQWSIGLPTQEELAQCGPDDDLRECRICHRRFVKRCNFDEEFS